MQVSTEQMLIQTAVAVAGIILGSLISEDAATLGAATLAATRTLDPAIAFAAAATGIWVGDLGLYALARRFGPSLASRPWFARRVDKNKIEQAHKLARRWGAPALALSRFVPGTRLAATLASGFLRMPVRRFAGVTAAGSVVWVLAVFCSVLALRMHTSSTASAVAIVALPLIALGVIVSRRKALAVTLTRWRQWEFWPPWVFYVPVAAMCVRLAMRYRGLALPTVANLN